MEEAKVGTKTPAVSGPWGAGWDEEPGDFKGGLRHLHNFWEGAVKSEPGPFLSAFSAPSLPQVANWDARGATRCGAVSVGSYFGELGNVVSFSVSLPQFFKN